jgi:hypothetical protein
VFDFDRANVSDAKKALREPRSLFDGFLEEMLDVSTSKRGREIALQPREEPLLS